MVVWMSYCLNGKTTSMRNLSCDTVIDGAFFPQPDLQVPQEEVGQHAGQDMVIPTRVFPNLVVVHTQFLFCFFKALLYGPAKPAEPHEGGQPGAHRSVADEISIHRSLVEAPSDNEPHSFIWNPVL